MYNFEKIVFWLKMYFRYSKTMYERSGIYKYFIFKVTVFLVELLREQVGRKANFGRVFLKIAYLNSASSRTWTIFIRST